MIYIGSLGRTTPSKSLEKKYLDIFDSAKHGVIYFSLGTVAQSHAMPPHLKTIFLEAFAEFPDINFIWKYENESHNIAQGYKNIYTFPFLPQNDLLEHPKLLSFITHGGMNSIIETATKGVPVICIPIFGDQHHNGKILEAKGTGIVIQKYHITKDVIVSAIRKITDDESYKNNAKLLSRMVKAKPMSAEEKIIRYTEFAAEFGDIGALQSEGRNLHWIQLYSIDVLVFLLSILLILLFLVYKFISFAIKIGKRFIASASSSKKNNWFFISRSKIMSTYVDIRQHTER